VIASQSYVAAAIAVAERIAKQQQIGSGGKRRFPAHC